MGNKSQQISKSGSGEKISDKNQSTLQVGNRKQVSIRINAPLDSRK
jgi:hypothetical protein